MGWVLENQKKDRYIDITPLMACTMVRWMVGIFFCMKKQTDGGCIFVVMIPYLLVRIIEIRFRRLMSTRVRVRTL